jgi:type I restriction enzyme S subunit
MWKTVKLGEVSIINPSVKGRLSNTNDLRVSFVPMAAVDAITGTISNPEIRKLGEVRKGYTYFENDDVIFAKITPCMQNGKHAIARNLINGLGFGSTEFHVIRPIADEILPEWIHYFLRQQKYLLSAENYMQGAVGQQRLPDDYLYNTQIPLPPFDEQKRIAAIIETKLKSVEKAKQAAEEQLNAADALRDAYLREVFGFDELPQGWNNSNLGDSCIIKGGKRLPKNTNFVNEITSHPYIRVTDFVNNTINVNNLKYIDDETHKQIANYIITKDDVYLSIAGTIGLVGIIPDILNNANLTENAVRINLNECIDKKFFIYYLSSHVGRNEISRRINKVGQPKLAIERIKTIPVPVPPLSIQNKIGKFIETKFKSVEKAKQLLTQQLSYIDALPAAILRKAFSGEL